MVHRRSIIQSNFDSVLHPALPGRPAQLIIRLRVALIARDPSVPIPRNPSEFGGPLASSHPEHLASHMGEVRRGRLPDANGILFHCRSWLKPEFNAFCIKFKQMVELSWNNQLILLPPDGSAPDEWMSDSDYMNFVSRPDVPAHVQSSIDIGLSNRLSSGRRIPHAWMHVLKLETPANGAFRSYQLLICDEDVGFTKRSGNLIQVTAAHEVGHWLGNPVPPTENKRYFPHIDDAYCAATPNHHEEDCYGRTAGRRAALLGAGQLVTDYEAQPWLTRVRRHTNVLFGWTSVHRVHFNNRRIPVSDRQRRLVNASATSP
jgi:hypothetical protein